MTGKRMSLSWLSFSTESQARPTLSILKQQQLLQNGTKDYETTAPMYEQVLHPPVSQEKSSDSTPEENNLHYADIHVLSQTQPSSRKKVKHLHSEAATEYATLRFPQVTPRYDSNSGTLVWAIGRSAGFHNATILWEQSTVFENRDGDHVLIQRNTRTSELWVLLLSPLWLFWFATVIMELWVSWVPKNI